VEQYAKSFTYSFNIPKLNVDSRGQCDAILSYHSLHYFQIYFSGPKLKAVSQQSLALEALFNWQQQKINR